jgi:glycosyltransferase involved in cell wall biosynthesis
MKLLTVVVPTYNMEKFLGHCLDSFIDETENMFSALEILIINDGSKDRSAAIAKKYEKKYPEIFRLINKENGGHGSTINRGIREATGKYFRVVDSDDWVDTKQFYQYLEKLQQIDADIVFTSYSAVDEQTGHKKKFVYNTRGIERDTICSIDDFLKNREIKMHTITYRTQVLKDNNIVLDEHCFYVDTEYVLYSLKYVNTCVLLNQNVYMYRTNMVTQSCSDEGYFRHCQDHEKVSIHLLEFVSGNLQSELSENKKKYFLVFVMRMLEKQYRIYLMDNPFIGNNRRDIMEFDRKVRQINKSMYRKLRRKQYIDELRRSRFRFYVLQKIKFYWMRKQGKYEGLDF